MDETNSQNARDEQRRMVFGYERALNALWIGVLVVLTWIFWSFWAAAILFSLFIVATIVGIWVLRKKK